ISFVQVDDDWERDDDLMPDELEAIYESALDQLGRFEDADAAALERLLGPIADRLLLGVGIAVIEAFSRRVLLAELLKALRDGMEVRRRKAGGDYTPDPKS